MNTSTAMTSESIDIGTVELPLDLTDGNKLQDSAREMGITVEYFKNGFDDERIEKRGYYSQPFTCSTACGEPSIDDCTALLEEFSKLQTGTICVVAGQAITYPQGDCSISLVSSLPTAAGCYPTPIFTQFAKTIFNFCANGTVFKVGGCYSFGTFADEYLPMSICVMQNTSNTACIFPLILTLI